MKKINGNIFVLSACVFAHLSHFPATVVLTVVYGLILCAFKKKPKGFISHCLSCIFKSFSTTMVLTWLVDLFGYQKSHFIGW